MASPSPFKALFSKQPISECKQPDTTCSLPSKKSRFKASKPTTTSTKAVASKQQPQLPARLSKQLTTAVLGADHDTNSQSLRLFSLLAPISTTSSSSSPTMLLPPTALFPALSAATAATKATASSPPPAGPKRQKAGLFSKMRKQKKPLLDGHHSTSTTTPTKVAVSQGLKGAWTGSSSIFRRDNDTTAADSQQQPATVPAIHRAGQQFGQIWKTKETADMDSSSLTPSDESRSKKTNWLSIPSLTSTESSLSSPNDHYLKADQLQYQQRTVLQRQRSRTSVTFAIQDIFGIGRMSEMVVALFLAHDCFLCRKPLWLQCSIMLWEGFVVLVVLWAVLRVIGLAEVVVWGADDIVRGSISLVQGVGQVLRMIFWR